MIRVVAVVVLLAGVMGCAARMSPVAGPKAGQPAAPAKAAPEPTMAPSTPPAQDEAVMPSTMPESKRKETETIGGAAGGLMEQFDAAEVIALSSGRDCSTACKALRSMSNAADQLCSIAQDDRERERCARAKERVRSAVQRVKGNCGSCPGGPALE